MIRLSSNRHLVTKCGYHKVFRIEPDSLIGEQSLKDGKTSLFANNDNDGDVEDVIPSVENDNKATLWSHGGRWTGKYGADDDHAGSTSALVANSVAEVDPVVSADNATKVRV